MNIKKLHPAEQIALYMGRIYDKGLTTTSGGNLSVMDDRGCVWITPAAVDKGALTREDIICVHPDGTAEGPHKPSSELPFHLSVYRKRPDLKAVLHAHPPALVTFSIVRRIPDLDILPALRRICGRVGIAPYGVPGSADLGQKIGAVFSGGCDTAILENHGVCVGGTDLPTAFARFETLNHVAEVELLARELGTLRYPDSLPEYAVTDCFPARPATAEEQAARREMTALIRRCCRMGLFTAAFGTCSLRLGDGSFLITPEDADRACLEEEDLVLIRNGQQDNLPSRDARLHSRIYRHRPGVRGILQAVPRHVMAFAVTEAEFDTRTIPESYVLLRELRKLPRHMLYAWDGQPEDLFDPVHPAMLVENDCAIVTGESLLQAFDRLEVLESTARSIIGSRRLGPIVHITDAEGENLKKAFHLTD